MKNFRTLSLAPILAILLFVSQVNGQTTRTVGGAGANYSRLKSAFDAINAGSITGAITLQITGSTSETSTATLNASGSGSASYTSVTIYPTIAGITISRNTSSQLINLNGADNVIIDGRVGASGSTISLTLTNTDANTNENGTCSTIRFINDASNNTVKYCNIKGSTIDPSTGIVFFSTTSGTTGNDGNTIDNNNITNSSDNNRPLNAIYSAGSSGKENANNIISNNNIINFLNKGTTSYGINISSNSISWTITGNSFYEISSFVPTSSSSSYYAIYINNTSGTNFIVNGNYIGGNAALCGGTAWTKTNARDNIFTAVYLRVGTSTASNVQNNTIKNFNWGNSSSASWTGINIAGGSVNIGTTSSNTIGSITGTGSITIIGGATGATVYGIYIASTGTVNCQNNNIGSIEAANGSANATNFFGINKTATSGTTTISNNTIGSITTANSINASSVSSANAQSVIAISNAGSGIISISDNTIANLKNGTTNTTTSTAGVINGIKSTAGTTNIISNNTINDLTIANANNSTTTASVCGIALTGASLKTVTGNTIYNLSNSYASFTGDVIGLYFTGSTIANLVSGNFIHSLFITGASSISGEVYGISIAAGATSYYNNIISLGGNTKTTIYGIYETGAASNNNNIYFNTVYLSGSLVSGTTNKSYALYSAVTTNTRNFRNNILVNARSTTGGASLHYAIYFNYASNSNLTLDYNDYYVSGIGGVLGYYAGGDITTLPVVTGKDVSSENSNPDFINAGSTIATYYKIQNSLVGVSGTGITTDYGSNSRLVPTIGAWEYGINKWKGSVSNNWSTDANWTEYYVPLTDADIIFDDVPLNNCQLDQDISVTNITNAQSGYRLVTNGYKLTVKGTFNFTNGAQIDASATNSTIEFLGVGTQSIPSGSLFNDEVYNLTINNPANVILDGVLRLLNVFTATTGRLDATTNMPTLVYAGLSAQTIGSSEYLDDIFHNLTIDNATGVSLTNNNLTTVLNSFTINSGKKFEIAAGKKFTVNGTFTNNAGVSGFVIHSNDGGTGSVIENTEGISATVERWMPNNNKFHYVSTPVTNALSVVYHYAWLYSWNEATQYWQNIIKTNVPIVPMKGYSLLLSNVTGNPLIPPNNPVIYTGTLNTGTLSSTITYTNGPNASLDGFNLVGNPYPSAIDWDAPSGWTKTNVNNSICIWNGTQYASYVNGVGANGGSRYIAAQQGFFVTSDGTTGTLAMNNNVRTHDSASLFRTALGNILRLKIENDSMSDETIIRFTSGATDNFDGNYDAYKAFGNTKYPQLYTLTTDNKRTAINSLPETSIESMNVPMNLRIGVSGNYNISASEFSFDNRIIVAIEDTKMHQTQIITNDFVYPIQCDVADTETRFVVRFYKNTPTSVSHSANEGITVFSNNRTIFIDLKGVNSAGAEMSVMNMLGQTVFEKGITSEHLSSYSTELLSGSYIVRIIVNGNSYEKKLYID